MAIENAGILVVVIVLVALLLLHDIQDAMSRILDAYVTQLDRWRGAMKSRT